MNENNLIPITSVHAMLNLGLRVYSAWGYPVRYYFTPCKNTDGSYTLVYNSGKRKIFKLSVVQPSSEDFSAYLDGCPISGSSADYLYDPHFNPCLETKFTHKYKDLP